MKIIEKERIRNIVFDIFITLVILSCAAGVCFWLIFTDESFSYTSIVFMLAVFLISRFTHGYLYGLISSFISILLVNFISVLIDPYFEFYIFSHRYLILFLCMLLVSIATSSLTTKNKNHEELRIESEREKTRSNLLRAVSHDLRTPLTSINGACSVMIENDDFISREERIKLLSEIKDESRWLIRMVENLLSITRIDGAGSGSAEIVKKHEAVEEIVADSVSKFKKQFPKSNITVDIPDEFILIPMDVILIEQVLMNLLENAVAHSMTATEIRLSVKVKDAGVEFIVSDNGSGISQNVMPHIFDGYFNKAYEKTGDTKRSMGIGLSVCNTIIKAHGGVMSAHNLKNGGACFTFTLPAGEE